MGPVRFPSFPSLPSTAPSCHGTSKSPQCVANRKGADPRRERTSDVYHRSTPTARERLIVLRVVTSPVERGEERFELQVPARALLDPSPSLHKAGAKTTTEEAASIVPWFAVVPCRACDAPRRLPYGFRGGDGRLWDARGVAPAGLGRGRGVRRFVPPAREKDGGSRDWRKSGGGRKGGGAVGMRQAVDCLEILRARRIS